MNREHVQEILERVKNGQLDIRTAAQQLVPPPIADLGYAQVDLARRDRCGFPEVVFCEGKTPEWVEGVIRRLIEAGQDCLATRVNAEQFAHLEKCFPEATLDRLGRTFWYPVSSSPLATQGKVLVVTAGTGDLPVAQEAVNTARAMRCEVDLVVDVGVAGIHRILKQRERLSWADVIIVAAGMDGALPSVVGGLVDCAVIAVPTSIGYGTAFHGVAALLTALNSCSANVLVVNIDAGFKAGYVAALIARRAAPKHVQAADKH